MNFPGKERFTWLLSLLAGIFAFPTNAAGNLQFSSRVWQTDDGLPQNTVQAIVQTHDGYLWVATQKGLARFDGMRFTVFDQRNVPQFKSEWIDCLCQSRDGSLWMGVRDGGVCRMKDGVFTHFGNESGLDAARVLCIFESKDGSLWFGARGGLRRFENGKFIRVFEEELSDASAIRSIHQDVHGALWIGATTGLFQTVDFKTLETVAIEGDHFLRGVCFDRNGALWLGTSRNGLRRLEGNCASHFTKEDGLADNNMSTIYEDRAGNLWVGTFGGLNRFVNGKFVTELAEGTHSFDVVLAICEDQEGNLWVGAKDGLYRLNAKRFSTFTTQHGLANNNVMSVFEDRGGTLWFGTWGGGLHRISGGQITTIALTNKANPADLILALAQTRDDAVWIGGDFDSGLFRLQNGQATRYGKAHGLDGRAVKVIRESKKGGLWVGSPSSLTYYQREKAVRFQTQDGLAGDTIRDICETQNGDLWIGTDGGLTRQRDGKFYTFTEKDGFGKKTVASLYEDKDGVLWIGTIDAGLHRFKEDKFAVFTASDGLFDNSAHEILEDDFGHFWMSCRHGVYRVGKSDLNDFAGGKIKAIACTSYGRADGMVTTECNAVAKPAGFKSRDGRLWFATAKGLTVTDPSVDLKKNEKPPPVVIEEVMADKRVQSLKFKVQSRNSFERDSSTLNSEPETLNLAPGRGELEFHYTALSFRAPEKNRFKYKLEGVDRNWVEVGTRRVAYYNNIPPGNYEFRVIGCNNDGVWNELGSSVKLTLQPHFWQTWWFKGSFVFCGIGCAGVVFRLRQNRRREIEKLRVRIAADLHDEIGANLASIALLSQMPSPDAEKSELGEINRIALNTASSIREIVWFINPDYDALAQMIVKMRDVAATMLSGFEYEFKSPDNPSTAVLPLDFRRNIFLVFKEILHNIVKHSKAAKVEIEVREANGALHLSIADNGVGFDEKTIRRGNGLKNIRLRLAQLEGVAEIRSEPGRGTRICVSARVS